MTSGRAVKSQLYEQFARIGKAVDSPQRLELLDLLCQGERPVEELAHEAHLSVANTSRHLQVLRSASLVDARKVGVKVYYRLADETVCSFFNAMRRLAEERLAEVSQIMDDYFIDPEGFEPVAGVDLMKRAGEGTVLIIDVRPVEEFRQGHLPQARSVPLRELEKRIADLPSDREIVAYCRGPYCVLAQEAVKQLRSLGYRATRFPDGIREWRQAGLPVVVDE